MVNILPTYSNSVIEAETLKRAGTIPLTLIVIDLLSARTRPNHFIRKNDYPNLDIAVNDNVLKYVTDIDLKAFGTINLSSK